MEMLGEFSSREKWTQADTLSGLRFREEDHICTCNGASSSSFSSFLDRRKSHLIPAAPQYNSLWASMKKRGGEMSVFSSFFPFSFLCLSLFVRQLAGPKRERGEESPGENLLPVPKKIYLVSPTLSLLFFLKYPAINLIFLNRKNIIFYINIFCLANVFLHASVSLLFLWTWAKRRRKGRRDKTWPRERGKKKRRRRRMRPSSSKTILAWRPSSWLSKGTLLPLAIKVLHQKKRRRKPFPSKERTRQATQFPPEEAEEKRIFAKALKHV